MFSLAITLIIGYFVTQFAGYVIHRILHNPSSGPIFDSHMDHHKKMYPPEDYLSSKYRDASIKNRPIWYYIPPALVSIFLAFVILPNTLALAFSAELVVVAWINDWFHTQFHIRGHWLERYKWFWRLRDLHWHHHVDESKNIGIFSWRVDKIMGTFEEPVFRPNYYGPVLTGSSLPPLEQKVAAVPVMVSTEPPAEQHQTLQ